MTATDNPEALIDLAIDGYGAAAEIGRGGFGTVYRASQLGMGREVAIKVLPGIEAGEQDRFEEECRATGALSDHPNIVSVHGAGVTATGRPWLAMQLCSSSMADRLKADGPLEWPEAVAAAVKLAGALETAHRAGILHRDIKPANVLLSAHGEPALADFGIARAQGASETTSSSITGTVEHTAPEVLSGTKASPASDVYSLASTLFALITGAPPFRKEGDEGLAPLMMRVVTEEPPDLREEGLPGPVADVLERALAKGRDGRYPTAEAFGVALQEAEELLGFPVTPITVHGVPGAWDGSALSDDVDLEGATRARVRPVAAPVAPVAAPATGRRRPALVAVGALVGVLALVLGLVVVRSGGPTTDVDDPDTIAHKPETLSLDLGVVRSRATGLEVHRVWTLAGENGTEFSSKVTLTNPTEAPVAAHDEVVPKELAASVIDIAFEPLFTEVIEADPVVRYGIDLAPTASYEFGYTIEVEGDGVSEARLRRWQRAQLVAQNAYDAVPADAPADVVEEGGFVDNGVGVVDDGTGGDVAQDGTSDGGGATSDGTTSDEAIFESDTASGGTGDSTSDGGGSVTTSPTTTPTTQAPTAKATTTTQQPTTTTTTTKPTTTTTTQPPPQNKAPTAYNDTSASIGFGANESGTKCWDPLVINPLNNDVDPEGQPKTARWVKAYDSNGAGLALGGAVIKSFNSKGNPHICLTASYASKVNSLKIEYRAVDSQGASSNIAVITVPVFRR